MRMLTGHPSAGWGGEAGGKRKRGTNTKPSSLRIPSCSGLCEVGQGADWESVRERVGGNCLQLVPLA